MKGPAVFDFSSKSMGEGFARARIVKPESGDFCLRFDPEGLVIFSNDKRSYARVFVPYEKASMPDGYVPEEFYVTPDKSSLFDSGLDSVNVKINPASVSIKAEGVRDGKAESRSATMKRRAKRSKRAKVPGPPSAPSLFSIRKDVLEAALRQAECSSQAGKTEEEMRVNQIHLYPDSGHMVSTTRFYGTAVKMTDQKLPDISIIGSDVSSICSFASRVLDLNVEFRQDKDRLYVVDNVSCIAFSRVVSKKPPLSLADPAAFVSSLVIPKAKFSDAMSWVCTTVKAEGTCRVAFSFLEGEDVFVMRFNDEEIARIPCSRDGKLPFSHDLHAEYLKKIVDRVDAGQDGRVRLLYGHRDASELIGISPFVQSEDFSVCHYMKTMAPAPGK